MTVISKRFSLNQGLSLLIAGVFVVAFALLAQKIDPAEDATILFRYSESLAKTGTISFNPSGDPVEGATDFLWMVLISGANKLGFDSWSASLILTIFCTIASLVLLHKWSENHWGRTFFLWTGFLLASQQWAALQGFSVAFLGLGLILLARMYWLRQSRSFLLCTLLVMLIRPDSLFVAGPLWIFYVIGEKKHRLDFLRQTFFFLLIPGLAYMTWRVLYFGEWFPLPYYVKGLSSSSGFQSDSVKYLLIYLIRYIGPLLIAVGIGLWKGKKDKHRQLIAVFISFVIIPGLFYATIVLEQNIANRFALPLLLGPLLLTSQVWGNHRWTTLFGGLFLLVSLVHVPLYFSRTLDATNQIKAISTQLSHIPSQRLATTEAGKLPYYSHWETMDLWGLNTKSLARRLPNKEDIEKFAPSLIVINDGSTPVDSMISQLEMPYRKTKTWDNMVFNTMKYIQENKQYEWWKVPFNPPPATPKDNWDRLDLEIRNVLRHYANYRGYKYARITRYDDYFLYKNSPYYEKLTTILQEFNAYPVSTTSIPNVTHE